MIRLALSLAVMAHHLIGLDPLGRFAVVGFYVFSGYGCAFVLDKKYNQSILYFWLSRLLRICPSYCIIWILSFFFVALNGEVGNLQWGRLIHQAWLLKYFFLAYAIMPFVNSKKLAWRWFWASFTVFLVSGTSLFTDSYFGLQFASLFFSLGAVAHWENIHIPREHKVSAALSYPVFLSHTLVATIVVFWTGLDRGWPLFFVALPPTLALSWLLVVAVERPVERYRKQLRSNHGH